MQTVESKSVSQPRPEPGVNLPEGCENWGLLEAQLPVRLEPGIRVGNFKISCPECGSASQDLAGRLAVFPANVVTIKAVRRCTQCQHTFVNDLKLSTNREGNLRMEKAGKVGIPCESKWQLARANVKSWVEKLRRLAQALGA